MNRRIGNNRHLLTLTEDGRRTETVRLGHVNSDGGHQMSLAVIPKKLLSVQETAQMLGLSSRTLYRMVCDGELPCIKVGKSVRYDPSDVQAYIDRNRTPAIA